MGRVSTMPQPTETLPGCRTPLPVPERHFATFGMGCFRGAERLFWEQPGVCSTA